MHRGSFPKLRLSGWVVVGSGLCLLVLLALFSFRTVQQSRDNVMYLAEDDLPLLVSIQQLNVQLLKVQVILYNYYLTADSALFAEQFPPAFDALSDTHGDIQQEIPDAPGLSAIDALIESLVSISTRLDAVMRQAPIDWDRSRSILDEMDPVVRSMDRNSLRLGSWIRQRITATSQESLGKVERTLLLISAMALASLLAAAIMVWTNARRLAALQKLEYLAFHDGLTELPNRAAFERDLHRRVAAADGPVQIATMKINHFQEVINRGGHSLGDAAVQAVAARLMAAIATTQDPKPTLYRFDGNLLAMIYPSGAEILGLADRLCAAMHEPCHANGHELNLSLGIGLTDIDGGTEIDSHALEEALQRADLAMNEARHRGHSGAVVFDRDLEKRHQHRQAIKKGLQSALGRSEFHVCYQPQLQLESGLISGAEALLRWRHTELGAVSPAEFIPIAEDDGLIVAIGSWVMAQACCECASWSAYYGRQLTVSVNVSARQMLHSNLVLTVERALTESGLSPSLLEVEITESIAISAFESVASQLQALVSMGVSIALDDFGTGYSSLSYLNLLPVKSLKIDKSFIRRLPQDQVQASSVKAIIGLAQNLGLGTIAEGVETRAQSDCLAALGCDSIQGYWLGKPLSNHCFRQFLSDRRPPVAGSRVESSHSAAI